MKPSVFDYARPLTLPDALRLLRHNLEDAKLLAGGQSLVPALNFRLANPRLLIDINGIPDMDGIVSAADGLRVGALARWYQVERSGIVASANPLLREAVRHVAHYQIRNRGTVGGSCAYADPAAELPAILLACDGSLVLRSIDQGRILPAAEFFRGALDTALQPDEIIVELRFPLWGPTRRWAFEEFARRRGDFAVVGVAVLLDLDTAARCTGVRMVAFGAADKAARLLRAEAALHGRPLTRELIAMAATTAAQEVDARSDIHAPAEYRRALTSLLIERCLCRLAGIEQREAA